MAVNKNPLRRLKNALRSLNLGTLDDARAGFTRGMRPASEDARSVLYTYRDQRGLDEPPQLAEQAARSGMLGNIREVASANTDREPNSLLPDIGFSDEMLRTRLELGQDYCG